MREPVNGGVSHWWRSLEGCQRAPVEPRPLPGPLEADVCVVGAGYTGLWTAHYLKAADPSLRVVVLEQRFAGYGASGRNGGWLTNEVTGGVAGYRASHGPDAVDGLQAAMNASVQEVVRFCEEQGVDAHVRLGGELTVARGPAQQARLLALHREATQRAHTDVVLLDAEQARDRVRVAGATGAVWHPHCARLHPARLVRGLVDVVLAQGVELYEGTPVSEVRPRTAVTPFGDVSARWVLRATEGFTADLGGLHREWLPMNSSMIATVPLPAAFWEEVGWSGHEALGDSAHAYMYAQRTDDDRIAFGGRGAPYRYGSRHDTDGVTPARTVDALAELAAAFFPALRDVGSDLGTGGRTPVEHAWSGVLGVPRDWRATVHLDRATGLGWAGGYVGTGVTATNLAGRTLRDLVLGHDTELTRLPWVGHRVRRWEVEPLRWLAVQALYATYRAADAAEARGRTRTPRLARLADRIAGRDGH